MSSNGVIQNLAHEEFLEINFSSGKTLSVEQAFEVPAGKQMTLTGAAGTLALGDNMTLSGTLNLPIANTTLSGGTVTLNGGTLQVDEDINLILIWFSKRVPTLLWQTERISIIPAMYLTLEHKC